MWDPSFIGLPTLLTEHGQDQASTTTTTTTTTQQPRGDVFENDIVTRSPPKKQCRDMPSDWVPALVSPYFAQQPTLPMPSIPLPQPSGVDDPRRARFRKETKFPLAGLMREEGGVFGHLEKLKLK